MNIDRIEPLLRCPSCNSKLVVYADYLGCEAACGQKLLAPALLGISIGIKGLRLMFPERISRSPVDITKKRSRLAATREATPRRKLKSAKGQRELF